MGRATALIDGQLVLDFAAITPPPPARPEPHRLGWIVLPREIAAHPLPGHPRPRVGDVLPGYVCCRCGGVELSEHHVVRSHGCCDPDTVRHPCDRRDRWPAWCRDWDAAWTLHHPGGVGEGRG